MTATNCPFCLPRIDSRKEPIHFETEHWRVTDNQTFYDGAAVHLLILPKGHWTVSHRATNVLLELERSQVEREAWGELLTKVLPQISKTFGEGSLLMRLGPFEVTGSTVEHLHLHWIVPKPGQTVYAHMGPRKWKSDEWQDLKKV